MDRTATPIMGSTPWWKGGVREREREREVVVCEFKLGAETSHGHTLTGFPFVGGHVGVFGGPEAVDSGPW
tara:strand:- start:132 stop:341 length:210 start_codon:yes stop_codon:yes gene_type:complete